MSNKTAAGGKLTFTPTCKDDDGVSTYTNDVTYGPDWYTNVSKGTTAWNDLVEGQREADWRMPKVADLPSFVP